MPRMRRVRYVNRERDIDINLGYLPPDDLNFYYTALRYFHQNVDSSTFSDFAFGPRSPVSRFGTSFRHDSLYMVLRDMWYQLSKQQAVKKNGR